MILCQAPDNRMLPNPVRFGRKQRQVIILCDSGVLTFLLVEPDKSGTVFIA